MDDAQKRELDRWSLLDWNDRDDAYDLSYTSSAHFGVIGACGRSGTTLLRTMLGVHSDIFAGSETSVFLPGHLDLANLANRVRIESMILERMSLSAPRAQFIDQLRETITTSAGKPLWIDKTSRNIHCFAYVRRHFPNACLIHVLRDPRDVVLSLRSHPVLQRTGQERKPTGWIQPWNDCLGRWERSIQDGFSMRGDPLYLEVAYEDLVFDRANSLKRICAFLSVDFQPEMLEHHRHLKPGDVDPAYIPNNSRAVCAVDPSRVGRWRVDLPRDVVKLISEQLGTLASQAGYDLGD